MDQKIFIANKSSVQRNVFLPSQKIKFRQVHTEQEWPIIELFLIMFGANSQLMHTIGPKQMMEKKIYIS